PLLRLVQEGIADRIVSDEEIQRRFLVVLNDDFAADGQTGGRLEKAHHCDGVVEYVAVPLDRVRGRDVELRRLDVHIVALARTQQETVRQQRDRAAKLVFGQVSNAQALH